MKKSYPAIALMVCIFAATYPVSVKAQFLKNVLNNVKQTVQNKANEKATQATNKALDKIDGIIKTKTATATPSTPTALPTIDTVTKATSQTANSNVTVNKESSDSGSSYIKLNLSAKKILEGGTVIISGSSVMYESLNKVALSISGPSNESKNILLNSNGSFSTIWQAGGQGNYKITVKSSDGKAQASATVSVYKFAEMEMITGPIKRKQRKLMTTL